jgi:peptidoglycan-associated lipoprotein
MDAKETDMKRMWILAAALVVVFAGAGCSKKVDTLRAGSEDEGVTGVQKESGMMTEELTEEMVEPEVAEAPMSTMPSGGAMMSGGEMARTVASRLRDIHFDFDKSVIRDDEKSILLGNADVLKANPSVTVTIEGHCDERGTTAYNLALGERRANATRRYLIALGVAPSQLATVSYGEERPVCMASDESCWSRNRRAHMGVSQ